MRYALFGPSANTVDLICYFLFQNSDVFDKILTALITPSPKTHGPRATS